MSNHGSLWVEEGEENVRRGRPGKTVQNFFDLRVRSLPLLPPSFLFFLINETVPKRNYDATRTAVT